MKRALRITPIIIALLLLTIFIPTNRAVDTDNDGMPDQWESDHGLNPSNPNDATSDLDHDGLSNIREYQNNTDPRNPLSGGRAKIAYTCSSPWDGDQMTSEKIDELMDHGINTFSTKGEFYVGKDINDPLPQKVEDLGRLAKEKGFAFYQGLFFTYRPPLEEQDTYYTVTYSDGVKGEHISPFCAAYWQQLTNLTVAIASLPINYPNDYRIDGVMFDFELYAQDTGKPGYFDPSWGFENQTFDAYCLNRGIENPHIPASERFNWLVDRGSIIIDPERGQHTGDYYLYLGNLIHGYAVSMREQVYAVNQNFSIGAYPSPSHLSDYWYWYYLPEIYSGWSTRTHPTVVWATEMYNYGGASRIPTGLQDQLLPEGWYNLTTIYPSHITSNYTMYGYSVSGLVNYYYYSGDWAYHLYNLLVNTTGYWIYTTKLFTDTYEHLNGWVLPCYDEANNTVFYCDTAERYEQEVQAYYEQMDIAHAELQQYLNDTTYQTSIHPINPSPARFEEPTQGYLPNALIVPHDQPLGENLSLSSIQFAGQQNFVIYATEHQHVEIGLKYHQYSSSEIYDGLTYVVQNETYVELTRGKLRDNLQKTTIAFTAPSAGNYLIMVNPGVTFEITYTNVPICRFGNQIAIKYTPSHLYFWVGNITSFYINTQCNGYIDGFNATILKPNGTGYTIVASNGTSPICNTFTFHVTVPPVGKNKVWRIDISYPAHPQLLEDVYVTFYGSINPYIGLTDNLSYFMVQNHQPVAENDTFTVQQNSVRNLFNILGNDVDLDDDVLEIYNMSQPTHGSISIEENNTRVYYTPEAGFTGDDTLNYTTTDGFENSENATVTIHVEPIYNQDYSGSVPGGPSREETTSPPVTNQTQNNSTNNTFNQPNNESDTSENNDVGVPENPDQQLPDNDATQTSTSDTQSASLLILQQKQLYIALILTIISLLVSIVSGVILRKKKVKKENVLLRKAKKRFRI
jgi:hypothetical protein